MTDNQKVYIRGVEGRGIGVIAVLEELGGKTDRLGSMRVCALGNVPFNVFIIGHDGEIAYTDSEGEAFEIIKDNYHEIKLQGKWSDGDILVRKDNDSLFCVYQEPTDNGKGFLCHVYVSKDTLFTGVTVPAEAADNYRKATDAEKHTFYSLINNDHHVWWDAVNKILVSVERHPHCGQKYYAVSAYGSVVDETWCDSSVDKALLRAGNWFLTKEEAEAAVVRVKKALKGEDA